MNVDPNRCKDQRAMCWKLFKSEIKAILERLNGMDKALELLDDVHEYRFQELNNLRKEYTKDRNMFVSKDSFDALDKRVVKQEVRSAVWIGVIVIFFTALQFVLKWF